MRVPLRRTLFQIWLLPLFFILPGVLNLLLYGLPVTDDTLAHLWRIARMHDSIRATMLFPRWFPDMLLGFGYPVLTYYASSTYYLVELLNLAGFGLQNALIALYCLLMWFACVGMVLLARDIYPRQSSWMAIVAGVAYAYTPYLLINLYVRGALAEFGLQALLPWLFWSFRRIWRAENPFHYLIISALTLGGLAFTHTISLLIVPPLLLAYNIVLAMAASERQVRLKCAFVAIVGAMGISCFFWGPLLVERNYITNHGLTIAKTVMLPANFHSWGTLIDPHFLYAYFNQIPWKLGLIQTSAAIVGVLFFIWQSRKLVARNEWWFWLGTATLCVSLMVEVAKPLWLSNDVMPIIQFPWRFLAILQLPIALLTALPLTTIGYRPARAIVATALGVLLIVVHLPRIDLDYLDPRSSQFNMGVHAYFDASEDKLIQGERFAPGAQEFRPRWTEQTLRLDPDRAGEGSPSQQATSEHNRARKITLLAANQYNLQLAVENIQPHSLRLQSYFFPGWRVRLDGMETLATYPTTNLGLLTVDIPAGKHVVDIAWRGTPLQFWSALVSQLTLVLLCLFLLLWRRGRWWLVALLPLLTFGMVATYVQPQLVPVQAVKLDASPQGLEFLGYMPPKLDLDAQGVQLSTYWLATETQPTPLLTRWQMVAASGEVVQEVTATPFYNGYSSHDWASNTLVDDGYWLPLPPALAAGTYQIQMTLLDEQSGKSYASLEIGAVTLKQPTKPVEPTHPLAVRLGENVRLSGYDFKLIAPTLQRQTVAKRPEIPVVYPGQTLEYTLYWQTNQAMNAPYVGFIHLVDHAKVAAVQQDQSPGPLLQPAALWTPYGLYPDRYLLPIQQGMESGLYTPMIGMYNKGDAHRLDVAVPGVEGVFDHYELPSVKVINPNVRPIGTKVSAHFGEFAELIRFHIEGDDAKGGTAIALGSVEDELPIQPGDRLTLTTYYKVHAPSPTALTRFVQVRNLQNQVFAQYDGEPQEGGNPSWAWVRGEIIADAVSITLPTNTPADQYTLYVGWYDAAANLARVPTLDRQNMRLVNDEYPLLKLNVTQ